MGSCSSCFTINACFAGVVGVGVGAYNHEILKPCIKDTHNKHAAPYVKQVTDKTQETWGPQLEALKPHLEKVGLMKKDAN
jgi:hypothetical protein